MNQRARYYRIRCKKGGREFPLREGFKHQYILTHEESRAIDKCAKRRGIKGIGGGSRYTTIGKVKFW